MPLLSFAITWMGYTLLVWGVATVRGCNVSFSAVAFPGKFTGCNPDQGSTDTTTAAKEASTITANQPSGNSGISNKQAKADVNYLKKNPNIVLQG